MPRFAHITVLVVGLCLGLKTTAEEPNSAPPTTPEHLEFFERQIRPLLLAKCIDCHGPEKQESALRLDSRAALLKGGELGLVVEPFHPDRSRIIEAVRQEGDLSMPPNGKLRDEEIAALERWIDLGAPWPENVALKLRPEDAARRHWSFRKVVRPALPDVSDSTWVRSPIDRFVLAKLEQAGIAPSPAADRGTLIRRLTFDLLGRPPAPDEVDAFEKDASPDAYPRLVDRLLASPQYGERWGRHWLDVARYADTKGYVFFEDSKYPWAYTYRDYVIHALNSDLPYDRFILQQLAADQLESKEDVTTLTAMGFLTLGGHFMNNTHDVVDDRIDVTMRGFLGLTVTCARCHDHKYDPIEQADYYALYGTFRSSYEPLLPPLASPAPADEGYQKFAAEMEQRHQKLIDFVTAKYKELTHGARTRAGEYLWAIYQLRGQPPTDDFMLLADPGDINPAMIVRWQAYLKDREQLPLAVWQPWILLSELDDTDFAIQAETVLKDLEADSQLQLNPLVLAALRAAPRTSMQDVAKAYGELLKSIEAKWQAELQLGQATGTTPVQLADPDEEQLRSVLYGPHSPADAPMLLDWGFLSLFPDRATQEEYKKLLKEVETWLVSEGAPPRAMVLLDSATPYEPHIFLRGNSNRLGDRVPRRYLSAFEGDKRPFQQGSGRLELAQAIASRDNPLTARVMVNRLWMHHFGTGLVRTPGDFGVRGEPPTHPELLDWLACELMDGNAKDNGPSTNAWSIKHLHRTILLSATYQQASHSRGECVNVDPENRLLWKQNRRRLEFESLRDSLLFVAGSLNTRMGGPSVQVTGDGFETRRTVYALVDRMDLPALLSTFDFPSPLASNPQRVSTTVPPQSLFMMNHPFIAEAAGRLVDRADVASITDTVARVVRIHQLMFGRDPSAEEQSAATEYLGDSPDRQQWARYVHGLMMTNEFSFVD